MDEINIFLLNSVIINFSTLILHCGKQFYQRIFIASLLIVTNIFCSTRQAYLLSHSKSSVEETILDSKIGTYSEITTSKSFFDIEESREELEEENISDDLNSLSYFSNFEVSCSLPFYFAASKIDPLILPPLFHIIGSYLDQGILI